MCEEFFSVLEDGVEYDCLLPEHSTIAEWIDAAAKEVIRRIDQANGGQKPKSLLEWTRCCENLGIEVVGVNKSATFSAIIMELTFDRWIIFYNSRVNSIKQSRYLVHELAEYMTRAHSWNLDAPQTPISAYHVRHMIARRVESLYFS